MEYNDRRFDDDYRQNNNSFNNRRKSDKKNKTKYVGAPYNFIPFSKKTIKIKEERMAVHDRIENGLLTGVIDYTIEAQTPILISDGNKEKEDFTRDELGRVVIPGSTMRGLIRNNVQVLGFSSFDDDIDDYNLMYRHVASGAEKKQYSEMLGNKQISVGNGKQMGVLANVRGGYVKNNNGKYEIYPAIEHFAGNSDNKNVNMSYYVLNERNILENIDKYPFFTKHENNKYMQYKFGTVFHEEVDGSGKTHYKADNWNKNEKYKPFYVEISFEASGNMVKKVDEPGICSNSGFLVGTGIMNEKKALYIIPQKDEKKKMIEIPQSDIKNFKIDFNGRKNTLKDSKRQNKGGEKIFDLPENGDERPVFFINGLDNHTYFGFTPRLRMFYGHKIKDGYQVEKNDYDYAKSLFGTTGDKSYKSKVSFSDALLESDIAHIQAVKVIQGEPKPTSYMDYLKQGKGAKINGNNNTVTYNTDDFELRGQKQYWLHKQKNELINIKEGNGNENVGSNIYPLKSGSKFCGKVRFQNLTNDELGLLLWSIRLNENSYMNVGKAKAYGGGVIKVKNINCCLVNYEKAYNINSGLTNNPFERVDNIDQYIEEYKKAVKDKGIVIEKQPSVKAFFVMKSKFLDDDLIKYMSLETKDYQNRKALPTIESLTGQEIGEEIYVSKKSNETSDEVVFYDDSKQKNIKNEKKKVQFEENKEYEAYVKKYKDGSNIQFSVNNQIVTVRTKKVEIDGQKVNKANMPELLPLDSKCILRYENKKMIFVSRSE